MAINKGKSEKEVLNIIIRDGLEINENKESKKEKIYKAMINKNTYNPNNNKKGFKSLKGFITAPKGFNPVKAVEEANLESWLNDFLDTNFIVGYFIKDHEFHYKSNKLFEKYLNNEMIISNLIINEVTNTLNLKLKKSINEIEKVYTTITNDFIVLDDSNYNHQALKYIKLYYPKRIPFNDCIFMAVMEYYGINEILSFDAHFDLNKNIKRIFWKMEVDTLNLIL